MPLTTMIQFECNACGNKTYTTGPTKVAKVALRALGYIVIGSRCYCDSKCHDNHTVILREAKRMATDVLALPHS